MPVEQKGEDIFSAPTILYLQHLKQLLLVPVLLVAIRLLGLKMKKSPQCEKTQRAHRPAGFVISDYFLEALCNQLKTNKYEREQISSNNARESRQTALGEREQLITLLFAEIILSLAV